MKITFLPSRFLSTLIILLILVSIFNGSYTYSACAVSFGDLIPAVRITCTGDLDPGDENWGLAPLDLMFVVDTTGSMTDIIEEAKICMDDIVEALEAKGLHDMRFGIVTFKEGYDTLTWWDIADPAGDAVTFETILHCPLSEYEVFKPYLNSVYAEYNTGSYSGRTGILDALEVASGVHWGPTNYSNLDPGWEEYRIPGDLTTRVCKVIILIGDAPGYCSAKTQETAAVAYEDEYGIYTHTIACDPTDNWEEEFFQDIAEAGNGIFTVLNETDDLADAIVNAIMPTMQVIDIGDNVRFVEPGETVVFNLTAWNVGHIDDYCKITVDELVKNQLLPGWSVKLSNYSSAERLDSILFWLPHFEYHRLQLWVTAPTTGVSKGDFLTATVRATLINNIDTHPDTATDTECTFTFIKLIVDFDIAFATDESAWLDENIDSSISPDETKYYTIGIINKGNIDDTYELELIGGAAGWEIRFINDADTDWEIYFETSIKVWKALVHVKCSEKPVENQESIIVEVKCPSFAIAGTTITITAIGKSTVDRNETRMDTLTIIVTQKSQLELLCTDTDQAIKPGGYAIFNVEAINNGNGDLDVTLEFEGIDSSSDSNNDGYALTSWSIVLNPLYFTIHPGQYVPISVKIHAPENIHAGVIKVVSIKGIGEDAHGVTCVSNQLILTSIVSQIYNITAKISPPEREAVPGETVNFTLTLTNHGNGEELVVVSIRSLETGWSYKIIDRTAEISTVSIKMHEVINLSLLVTVPTTALADSDPTTETIDPYKIHMVIEGEQDKICMAVDVKVKPIYDIELKLIEYDRRIEPGSAINIILIVINHGNTWDCVNLTFSNFITGGYAYFVTLSTTYAGALNMEAGSPINFCVPIDMRFIRAGASLTYVPIVPEPLWVTVKIGVGQIIWFGAVGVIPKVDFEGSQDAFILQVDSMGDELKLSDNSAKIDVVVKLPDLMMASNAIQTIPATIKDGDLVTIRVVVKNVGEIEADLVKVVLYIDRQEFGTKILKLPPGAEKELTFTWRATHGKHKLKLVIDPYDTIIESYEDNNFVEKQIDVCEKASTGLFANWDKIELPFILMIITCIAIVTIIILLLIRRGSSTLG